MDIAEFVDVAQSVGFVHYHQVPGHAAQIVGLGLGKLIRADEHAAGLFKRLFVASFDNLFVAFGLQDQRLQAEFVLQFLMPMLAQIGRGNDEDVPFALGPALGDDQTGFDGFT